MLPKFSNPHLLHQFTRKATRAEVCNSDAEVQLQKRGDPLLVAKLEQHVNDALGLGMKCWNSRPKKIGKSSADKLVEVSERLVEFRLLSYSVSSISLGPKLPPPSTLQEPECEDDAETAELRQQQAQIAAVDYSWLIQESQRTYPPPHKSGCVRTLNAVLPSHQPVVLVIQCARPSRSTRPAIMFSKRKHYQDALALNPNPPPITDHSMPLIEINTGPCKRCHQKRKRKRGKTPSKTMPQPTFWQPSPDNGYKGLGYAYGYRPQC